MTDPRRFSKATMREAYDRAEGCCEVCTAALTPGNTFYDHVIPWTISRDSSLSNAAVLCKTCHDFKTAVMDIPRIAKGVRLADRHVGIRPIASRPMPGGRNSGLKKTMRGEVVARFNLSQMLRQMGLVK